MSSAWSPETVFYMIVWLMVVGCLLLFLLDLFGVSIRVTVTHETDEMWVHHVDETQDEDE